MMVLVPGQEPQTEVGSWVSGTSLPGLCLPGGAGNQQVASQPSAVPATALHTPFLGTP